MTAGPRPEQISPRRVLVRQINKAPLTYGLKAPFQVDDITLGYPGPGTMPLYTKGNVTKGNVPADLVARLARLRGVTKQAVVKRVVDAELNRARAGSFQNRLKQLWTLNSLPARTEKCANKRFSTTCPANLDNLRRRRTLITIIAAETDALSLASCLERGQQRLYSAINAWETVASLCRTYTFPVEQSRDRVIALHFFCRNWGFASFLLPNVSSCSPLTPMPSLARGGIPRS